MLLLNFILSQLKTLLKLHNFFYLIIFILKWSDVKGKRDSKMTECGQNGKKLCDVSYKPNI